MRAAAEIIHEEDETAAATTTANEEDSSRADAPDTDTNDNFPSSEEVKQEEETAGEEP